MVSLPVDLNLGWRGFRSHPWVSAVAVVTLALGIAGATTMFTMLTAIGTIMVPPGVDPARVGRVAWTNPAESGARAPLAGEEFRQLAAAKTVFETVSASVDERLVLGGEGGPSVSIKRVSFDFFHTFGFEPSAGRLFSAAEGRHGDTRVAIVSEGLTRRVPGLGVGGVVRLGNSDHAIVGVLPDRCWFPTPDGTDVWLPLEIDPNGVPAARSVTVTVRLRFAADLALAQAQVEAVGSRLEPDAAATRGRRLRVITLEEDVGKRMGFGLAGFIGPSIVVLLIACGNVANLLLAGAARRERDAAVRAALGASRFRLIKERLSESAGLGVAGGVLGIGLAVMGVWLLRLWVGSFESAASAAERIRLNGPSLLFALVLTLATPLIFGIVPAWAASKPNLVQALHQAPGRRRPRRGPYGGGDLLVIVEVGLAVVLVVAAGMFSRFFAEIGQLDWGFDPTKVLAVELSLGRDARDEARVTRVLAGIRAQ